MKRVVIGQLGTTLDMGKKGNRWNRWRPSVAVCQHDHLPIDEYHLVYQPRSRGLADRIIEDIREVSPETDVISHVISCRDPWDFEEVYELFLDLSKVIEFDLENNEYLIHITTGTHVAQICMFLLIESKHFPGKILQTAPPQKTDAAGTGDNSGSITIIDLDLAKYDRLAARFALQTKDDISYLKSGIQTRNPEFNQLIASIETVAVRSKEPILITGPTGAGKSLLAKRIYELKLRNNQVRGNFIEVNCATLRGDAAMSALFGHKKGSFTGAVQDRKGLLKAADKGICFLDEIGELGLDEQAMLLRAIEEKRFFPVGADREEQSDFLLICGTNRNLKKEVIDGHFREDLLARIQLWTFELPGLKNRLEDIEPNLDYELVKITEKMGKKISINREARRMFLDFAFSSEAVWSSNFRDLNGAVTRMATFADDGRISVQHVEEEIIRLRRIWKNFFGQVESESRDNDNPLYSDLIPLSLDLYDQFALRGVLQICFRCNSLSEAGRSLFSHSRKNKQNRNDADRLGKYLKRFNLSWQDIMNAKQKLGHN